MAFVELQVFNRDHNGKISLFELENLQCDNRDISQEKDFLDFWD